MRIRLSSKALLLAGALLVLLAPAVSAQCGMYGMIGLCTPAVYGGGMTCTGSQFIACAVGAPFMGPMGGTITMGVPCIGIAPAPGAGVVIMNSAMVAGGATCMDTGALGTMTGTHGLIAMGMGPAATCQVLHSLMCGVSGNAGTMSMCTLGGNQTIARGCTFNATPGTNNGGLPVELMEFSVEDEPSAG